MLLRPPFGVCRHWERRPWPRCVVVSWAALALWSEDEVKALVGPTVLDGSDWDFVLYVLVRKARDTRRPDQKQASCSSEKKGQTIL